jgi:hypothetical protein
LINIYFFPQIENEFGFFGNAAKNPLDKQYLEILVALAREVLGNNVILYTTDGGTLENMQKGAAMSLSREFVEFQGEKCIRRFFAWGSRPYNRRLWTGN